MIDFWTALLRGLTFFKERKEDDRDQDRESSKVA